VQRGLVSVQYDDTQHSRTLTATPAPKRKLGDTDFEVADSDDEGYGWDDDEELPPMPSQWQGSEDLLLLRKPESDDDDEDDEHPVEARESEDEGPVDGNDSSDPSDQASEPGHPTSQ
jgi:hypothetical protein